MELIPNIIPKFTLWLVWNDQRIIRAVLQDFETWVKISLVPAYSIIGRFGERRQGVPGRTPVEIVQIAVHPSFTRIVNTVWRLQDNLLSTISVYVTSGP